jgi:hypothetical protein
MRIRLIITACVLATFVFNLQNWGKEPAASQTAVTIQGDQFLINGKLTYAGRTWRGHRMEGLLLNSRMVQGIFDDLNPETANRWTYPDTGKWDPERNVNEFVAAMPAWRSHGLLAVTVNLQGGSPEGYSKDQPWINSAFETDGRMRPAYLDRMKRILDQADQLGMAVIVGYFYFGQDNRLADEAAVLKGVDNATQWLLKGGWRNVLVEIANECDGNYSHEILQAGRVHDLIARVRRQSFQGRHLPAGVSYKGNTLPGQEVMRIADFILLHGSGVQDPKRIGQMVRQTRSFLRSTPKPILFNEDDHFDFDKPENNFFAAIAEYASWGFFDYRLQGEGFDEGYQSIPVNWGISSERKRSFFDLLAEITGSKP